MYARSYHCTFTHCTQITNKLNDYMDTDYTPCCHSAWARETINDCMAIKCTKCVRVNNTGDNTGNMEFCGLCGYIQVTEAPGSAPQMSIHDHVQNCLVRKNYCGGGRFDFYAQYGEKYVIYPVLLLLKNTPVHASHVYRVFFL